MRADQWDDILLDVARMQREAINNIAAKMASQQFGEAWVGLDDRRHNETVARGPQRRKWKEGEGHEVHTPSVGEHNDGGQRRELHVQPSGVSHPGDEPGRWQDRVLSDLQSGLEGK